MSSSGNQVNAISSVRLLLTDIYLPLPPPLSTPKGQISPFVSHQGRKKKKPTQPPFPFGALAKISRSLWKRKLGQTTDLNLGKWCHMAQMKG